MANLKVIAHISTEKYMRGGENQALMLANGLERYGYKNVFLARANRPLAKQAIEDGFIVKELNLSCKYNPILWYKIASFLKSNQVNLVHAHDANAMLLAAIASYFAKIKFRVASRRVMFKINSVFKYNHGADLIICVSEAVKEYCLTAGINENKLGVVYDGIDYKKITNTSASKNELRNKLIKAIRVNKSNPLFILIAAACEEEKGHKFLLEALPKILEKIPQAHLLIAGEGSLRKNLEKKTQELNLDNDVSFLGFRKDMPDLYACADLFILPSIEEGLGSVIMEAMLSGCVVVASDTGGIKELIENNITGKLIEPGNVNGIILAVLEVLENNDLRSRMSELAKSYALKNFTSQNMVDKTLELYQKLEAGNND